MREPKIRIEFMVSSTEDEWLFLCEDFPHRLHKGESIWLSAFKDLLQLSGIHEDDKGMFATDFDLIEGNIFEVTDVNHDCDPNGKHYFSVGLKIV